ncbi:hypothetical protein C2E23DRAFT_157903 [Lenzites betulinus]|nr:hypothetical protein C2E23DRAFT_157903 [Lenzites betulinus]
MTGLTGDFARYVQNVAMPWPHDRTEDLTRVAYIVQCAIAVHHRGTTSSMDALVFSFHFIHGMNEWFPLDCPTVISQGLYAGNEEGPLESTLRRNEDLATAVVRRSRSLRSEAVFPHFVGEIIARVGGTQESGCVIGWREGTASVRDEGAVGFSNTLSIRVLGTRAIETVTWPPRLESRTLSKADARNLYRSWKHFGRHFEDVSIEGMREGQEGEMLPTRLVLTAEIQARYPDDVLLYSST